MEQTLQQLLADRVTAYAQSDRPRALIDEGIEKLFKDVVNDTFRSYGDFGSAIKEALKSALPANVSDVFELQRYNALVANALRERWEAAAVNSAILEQADKSISEVLTGKGLLTDEVSLTKLLEAFIDDHKEQAAENHWERPEIRISEGDSYGSGTKYLHIYFDPESDSDRRGSSSYRSSTRSDYELKHSMHVRVTGTRETTDHFHKVDQLCEVYSAKLDDKKVAINMQIVTEWERLVASLYFGSALLVIDCDPDDFSYGFD
ncbi:hypothetical protein [Pseudomonas typographi]|uniref:hypothetical protein n=1 Tax=Pseudomonas typographi TaxID=2715964 RepID=UPI001688AC1F|nr:hypothetical protein [Pseudomonas typographi]MBD1555195.1 hypothetical protein [Pseudomonas typographi]